VNDLIVSLLGPLSVVGWALYLRERGRTRDLVTDLSQLVHDHDVHEDDLRRSGEWLDLDGVIEEEVEDGDRR
jgi:hypothetical protein